MIKSDGVGCSILFIRLVDDKPIKITRGLINKMKNENKQYIEKVRITDKMKKKKVVCIDPGKSDIVYCLANGIKHTVTIRDKKGSIISNKTKNLLCF